MFLPDRSLKPTPTQAEALKRAKHRDGYGYLLDPGMGKTAVGASEFLNLLAENRVDMMIVFCPAFLRSNWQQELLKYGVPMPVVLSPDVPHEFPCVWVVHYEAIIAALGDRIFKMLKTKMCYVFIDESTGVKNFQARRTKRLIEMCKEAEYVRIGTGTPMPQSVMDLWPQLRLIRELSGVNPYQFRNRYAVMGGYMGKKPVGIRNEDELRELLDSCCFRATKPDDAFPRSYGILNYEMTTEQRKHYKDMMEELIIELGDGEQVYAEMVITKLLKLQQIACGFIIDNEGNARDLMTPEQNPRVRALLGHIEDVHGKVIIFTHHRHSTTMLRKVLPGAEYLMGGMAPEEMTERKDRFNGDPECRWLIGQASTTSRGHTLLGGPGADRCHTTYFFENTYSLETRIQSEDRNRRIGQTDTVQYWDLVAAPIDMKVINALQSKRDLMKALIDFRKELP